MVSRGGGATRIADTGFVGITAFIRTLRSETDAEEGAVCGYCAACFFRQEKAEGWEARGFAVLVDRASKKMVVLIGWFAGYCRLCGMLPVSEDWESGWKCFVFFSF